jgi:hypothetical protein
MTSLGRVCRGRFAMSKLNGADARGSGTVGSDVGVSDWAVSPTAVRHARTKRTWAHVRRPLTTILTPVQSSKPRHNAPEPDRRVSD